MNDPSTGCTGAWYKTLSYPETWGGSNSCTNKCAREYDTLFIPSSSCVFLVSEDDCVLERVTCQDRVCTCDRASMQYLVTDRANDRAHDREHDRAHEI